MLGVGKRLDDIGYKIFEIKDLLTRLFVTCLEIKVKLDSLEKRLEGLEKSLRR